MQEGLMKSGFVISLFFCALLASPFISQSSAIASECVKGGCNGELCIDENESVRTPCVNLPEYACYKNAHCERQSNGACGWTKTSQLLQCLNQKSSDEVPPPVPNQASPSTIEGLSQTQYSLPGDAILQFRVIDIQGRDITVDIDYRFNSQHRRQVMVGAWLKGVNAGYTPTFVPSPLKGTARLRMSVTETGFSTDIDIFLYEYGRPAEPFARRSFPWRMRFQ